MAYHINEADCVGCGACAYICPFGFISEVKDFLFQIDETKCVGCGQCADACINSAISPAEGQRKIKRVYIDEAKCIGCSLCKRNCPADAIEGIVKQPFKVLPERCVLCGNCAVKCRKEAVVIEYFD